MNLKKNKNRSIPNRVSTFTPFVQRLFPGFFRHTLIRVTSSALPVPQRITSRIASRNASRLTYRIPGFTLTFLAAFLLIALAAFPLSALPSADQIDDEPKVVPRTETPPVIDGKLDDPAWAAALKTGEFVTFEPDIGNTPTQKTIGYLTYDSDNFYFAARCFDTEPGKIKAVVSKRDDIFQDDIFGVLIDTFNDEQGGFGFLLNPHGIQGDGYLDINGNLQGTQDMVWYSAGSIDDQGWTVEARVPLQSIRFPNKKILPMRVIFIRFHTRTSEQMSYPPLNPAEGSIMGQSLPIQVSELKYKRVIEILPAYTYGANYSQTGGDLTKDDTSPGSQLSLTGKVGITSDLTLDGTINPDFSQVEADAGQVDINLRYALFYPEKRPFFLEGEDLWRFGGAMEEAPLASVVYTRTIIDPTFGFKLTGKLTRRDTVAAIYAQDNLPDDAVDTHPDFTILRYRHALKEDSFIGGFYTGREYGPGYNRVGGLDGRIRLSKTTTVSFHLFGSFTKPGAETPTNKDHALSLAYNYSSRKWIIEAGYQDISEDFQVDTGFVMRTGLRRIPAFAMYQMYPESKLIKKIDAFYWSYHIYDTFYDMWETTNVFVTRFWLPRSTEVRFEALLANEVFSGQRFTRNGYGFRSSSQLFRQLFVNLFIRRMGSIYYDPEDPYQGYGTRFNAGAQFQPTDKLTFGLSLTYADFFRKSDREKIYDYTILRSRNTFQINKYLFVRGIVEYNFYRKRLTADLLASFTLIPGTVVYAGYGSAFEKLEWDGMDYIASDRFLETKRGFFFKVSYLWRI